MHHEFPEQGPDMTDPHRIATIEELREVIGQPHPGVAQKITDRLDEDARQFIAVAPFLVLTTADAEGRLDASPKGDAPGFVMVEDEQTLVIPDRPGNKLAYGHLNILATGRIGLLFVVPNTSETLRINGRAELTRDPGILRMMAAREKPAVLAIRVFVEECFFHCGKAFIRSGLWAPESWRAKQRVSFGSMYARRTGGDQAMAEAIDQGIEADYRNNL